MEFLGIMIVILSLMSCEATMNDTSSSFPSALSYWNHKLPTTPIPPLLLGRLSSLEANRLSTHNYSRNSTIVLSLIRYYYPEKEPTTTGSSGTIFFLEKNLGIGTKFSVDLVRLQSAETLYFIPAVVANQIPFSTKQLSVSLDKLHIPSDSMMASTMNQTLQECERSAMIGENLKCVTSLESMIDYTTSELGTNNVNVFVSNVSKITASGLQQYSIASIHFESKPTSRVVACHTLGYAYLVYFCHQIKDTRMFRFSLKSDEGNSAIMVAVCHEDTSQWSPEHIAFKMLNVKPGGEPICHFMTEDNIVWIASS